MTKVFLIHRWGGNPKKDWYSWLKKELEKKNIEILIPSMPNPEEQKISQWVQYLEKNAGSPNEETFFIGHSVGCQTILRYLEKLPQKTKVGGVLFVAGWMNLTAETLEDKDSKRIAEPWIKTPIDWEKVKSHTKNFIAIFSDNDPYVPLSNSKIFKKKLGAKIIIEKKKGHFDEDTNVTQAPYIFDAIKKLIKT